MATSPRVREQVDFMSLLGEASRQRLEASSKRVLYAAGRVPHHAGDAPHVYIVERGLIRIFWSDPDGRQATISYSGRNELIGGTTIMGGQWAGGSAQAVVDSTLLHLNLADSRAAAAEELDMCTAVAMHLAAHLRNAFRTIAVRSLGNVAQRLSYDILERACRTQLENGRLEAMVTHADLAASIGSSREVISRTLGDYRAAGLVDTSRRIVRVLKPVELAAMVRSFTV